MSSFRKQTRHPKTGKYENADWIDDLFGPHRYGVVFPSDRETYPDLPLMAIAFDPEKVTLIVRRSSR